jgi:hypothetical protein
MDSGVAITSVGEGKGVGGGVSVDVTNELTVEVGTVVSLRQEAIHVETQIIPMRK